MHNSYAKQILHNKCFKFRIFEKLCIFFRNTDNDPRHSSIIGKFKQCKDQIQKIGVIYNEIKTKPFRIIGV